MDNIFYFIKEKVIDEIRKPKKNKSSIISDGIIDRIEKLENLAQLISYIEKKLINYRKSLKGKGMDPQKMRVRLINEKSNNKLNEFLVNKKVESKEIFKILMFPHKKRKNYLIKNHKELAKILKDEKISPFKKRRIKNSNGLKGKIRLIYTPMGNKIK